MEECSRISLRQEMRKWEIRGREETGKNAEKKQREVQNK